MPTHIPKGEMCLTCVHARDSCASLSFKSMQVIGKFKDEDGTFKEVACTNRRTKGITELEREVDELKAIVSYYESEEYKDSIQEERLQKYLSEFGDSSGQ